MRSRPNHIVISIFVAVLGTLWTGPATAQPSPVPSVQASDLPRDVPPQHWAATSVRRALQLKAMILTAGRFDGNQTATRLDLSLAVAAVLEKAGKAKVKPAIVKDAPAVPSLAKACALAAGSGAVKLKKGRLYSDQPINRDDLAVAVSKLMSILKNEPESPVADPIELNDVPPDSPFYIAIQRSVKAKMISLQASKYEGYIGVTRYLLSAVMIRIADSRMGGGRN
jgi:hypothetical protein